MPTDPNLSSGRPTPGGLPQLLRFLCLSSLLLLGIPTRLGAQTTNRWTGSGDGTAWKQWGRVYIFYI